MATPVFGLGRVGPEFGKRLGIVAPFWHHGRRGWPWPMRAISVPARLLAGPIAWVPIGGTAKPGACVFPRHGISLRPGKNKGTPPVRKISPSLDSLIKLAGRPPQQVVPVLLSLPYRRSFSYPLRHSACFPFPPSPLNLVFVGRAFWSALLYSWLSFAVAVAGLLDSWESPPLFFSRHGRYRVS